MTTKQIVKYCIYAALLLVAGVIVICLIAVRQLDKTSDKTFDDLGKKIGTAGS